eukprot:m.100804 g.100804  ORF g.100804 m.100804 type:complete len:238 (+) comp20704_c0_seq3:786-1499(+)
MAFSNSPPAWMTVSGSSTGSKSGSTDNLKDTEYGAFAEYLANVTAHFHASWNTTFDAVTPINEAANGWWKTGGSQEGCHFEPGSESKIVAALGAALKAAGVGGMVTVAGPEENSIDTSVKSLQAWSDDAIAATGIITTHTYNGVNRLGFNSFAVDHGKRLWASEYGTGSGPLQGGIQLAQRIIQDLAGMPNLQVRTRRAGVDALASRRSGQLAQPCGLGADRGILLRMRWGSVVQVL